MEFNEIDLHDATADVLQKVKLQIEKDLALCNFTYPFETVRDLPALVPELLAKIEELKQRGSADIMKIIFRVDLTERQYKKVGNMEGEWALNLAKAIVLREFQKIVIRKRYG